MMPTTMTDIEQAAREYSRDARVLRNLNEGFNDAVDKIKKTFEVQMTEAAKTAAESKAMLEVLVNSAPELFEKPRSYTFADVKVGYQKQKGTIDIPNTDGTIAIIREDFKDIAATAVKVKETLVKEVLAGLSGSDLKKLGVNITADTDAPFVKFTDTEVQKIIEAIIEAQSKAAQ